MESIKIHGKDYVTVNERLKEFRDKHPKFTLESDITHINDQGVIMKAVIKAEDGRILATGHAQETKTASGINSTSYLENCETSAWGRALANFGIGIDASVASAEEVSSAIGVEKPTSEQIFKKEDTPPVSAPSKNTIG